MALKKKIIVEETIEDVIEAPVVEVTKSKVSTEYKQLLALIESYKESNPEKYEAKKETLLAKLETLK
jgi:hypothetical protein